MSAVHRYHCCYRQKSLPVAIFVWLKKLCKLFFLKIFTVLRRNIYLFFVPVGQKRLREHVFTTAVSIKLPCRLFTFYFVLDLEGVASC